ncbi:MAG: filamentous hemagglutinin N-terminal domain-containing protein, partial [Proteobacteria bacterium]|nr:filamentous hemagglutinin N-terminal domain-containing protein [Pseudomonadota bacterium]
MFYSASFTESRVTRFGRFDRAIARLLVAAILWMTPLPAFAGDEFQDANNTSYDTSVVSLDNSLAGETTFTIDTTRTIIDWQDFQQPANNTLDFHFVAPIGDSTVLNRVVGSTRPSNIFGTILSNGNVIVANRFGVFVREGAVVDVGSFVAVGANISRQDFQGGRSMVLPLTGSIYNGGLIRAEGNISLLGRSVVNDGTIHSENGYVFASAGQHLTVHDRDALTTDFLAPKKLFGLLSGGEIENNGSITARDAALFAGRIQNMGDIEVRDGTLLMVAAAAVCVTEFDNPVLFKIPSYDPTAYTTGDTSDSDVQYAIENHGRLDAGLGHVRLAASDPLGFAIRQGTGTVESAAIIVASEVTIEGGESGRVHLSGEIDADGASEIGGAGGEINITGEMIVLEDADIHASGSTGGGTIHVGGEQEGRGDLQRARLVVVDEESEIRADAIDQGDGGTVIVFAEDFTSVDGEISARGGAEGGDGGFVETSGLARFSITRTPDVTAPAGRGGDWLIDPFNITIDNTPIGADTNLNNAILAILDPTFDSAGFDGILRTVSSTDMDMNGDLANLVSADLIEDALAAGTSVTLSTQAFGVDRGSQDGNINILSDIVVLDGIRETIEGTRATLRLLAARDINVESNILAYDPDESVVDEDDRNFALTIELSANDLGQVESNQDFDASVLEGALTINGDLSTGGGDVILTGSSVKLNEEWSITTEGGLVDIRSGTIDRFGNSVFVTRQSSDPMLDTMTTPDPTLDILGDIDTRNGSEMGGAVSMVASSINVRTSQAGTDPEQIISGQLTVSGMITSGGGFISLSGGVQGATASSNFAGNVDIDGDINSGGGAVAVSSNHIDPNGETGTIDVTFLKDPMELGGIVEGGFIDIDADITTSGGTLTVGSGRTRSIAMDGVFDTTQMSDATENGLVQIVARDLSGVSTVDGEFGFGEITIGGT